jgi:hypothetical protein
MTLTTACSRRLASLAAACIISVSTFANFAAAAGDGIETPPTAPADAVLGALARGENYSVASPVRGDGLLQIFTVDSKVGRFTVHGRQLLNRRIRELQALAALERMSTTDVFAKSAIKSATSPVKFGMDLLKNPFGTVEQTVSGVSDAFGKIGSGLSNPGTDPDGLAASAIGVSSAKRQLAAELDIDPYTDFKPLADKLNDVATTIALGGLGPKAAFSLIGGGLGMAISYSSTAEDVRNLIRDKTPSQLFERNAQALRAMGVSDSTAAAFLENEFYTLTDQTRIVVALQDLGNVANRAVFIARAAGVHARDLAFFLVRRAEMIADYQRASSSKIVEFVSAGGFPVNIRADGRTVVVAPIDLLAWSATPLQALAAITSSLRSEGRGEAVELHISGTVTPRAQSALQSMGWTVTRARQS